VGGEEVINVNICVYIICVGVEEEEEEGKRQ
jgi:hypothetical protein